MNTIHLNVIKILLKFKNYEYYEFLKKHNHLNNDYITVSNKDFIYLE